MIKVIIIAAVIIALGATTVFTAKNSDWLKEFFEGDTSAVHSNVITPMASISDGRFTLTLEQVLAICQSVNSVKKSVLVWNGMKKQNH